MPKTKGAPQPTPGSAEAKKAEAARKRANAARRAKAKKQRQKRKKCKDQIDSKKRQQLRDATPSKALTNKMNKAAKKPLKCPFCGRGAPFSIPNSSDTFKQLSPDHIVPFDEILKKPGFACLSDKNQKKVLNNPSNFVAGCPNCNLSRKTSKWNQWTGHQTFGITQSGKNLAADMAAKAPGLSKNLSAQITRLL